MKLMRPTTFTVSGMRYFFFVKKIYGPDCLLLFDLLFLRHKMGERRIQREKKSRNVENGVVPKNLGVYGFPMLRISSFLLNRIFGAGALVWQFLRAISNKVWT